jgi:phosphoribosylformimino-5-aminoimidazole carboxamide ribotide isomerase
MLIIPAIDIKDKNVVRLRQGDFSQQTLYSDNPVEVALKWQSEGAKLLHIVDLDGALTGEPKNLAVIEQICDKIKVPIEVGGGLRSDEVIESLLSKKILRVIIGTKACADEKFLKRQIEKFGNRIAVSIDAVGENVATKGWKSISDIDMIDFAKRLEGMGLRTVIYTNVTKDGTLESPQIEPIKKILNSVKIDVIASGGISSLEDIKQLKALARPNLIGVIVGKALYERRFSLTEAVNAIEGK